MCVLQHVLMEWRVTKSICCSDFREEEFYKIDREFITSEGFLNTYQTEVIRRGALTFSKDMVKLLNVVPAGHICCGC